MAETRNEHLLNHCIEGEECKREPKSRIEKLLVELNEKINNASGGVSIYTLVRED